MKKSTILGMFLGFMIAVTPIMSFGMSSSVNFSRDLKLGDTGVDVFNLQKFLNSCPDTALSVSISQPGSIGNETTRLGMATQSAIKSYQVKNALPVTAVFDIQTRNIASTVGNVCGNNSQITTLPNSTVVTTNSTTTESYVDGCSSVNGYSTTTGRPCAAPITSTVSTIPGCQPGFMFSSINGMNCNEPANNTITECLSTTKPWIKLLSPNGDDTLYRRTHFPVEWKTCNVSKNDEVAFELKRVDSNEPINLWIITVNSKGETNNTNIAKNTGESSLFIPGTSSTKGDKFRLIATVQNDDKNKFTDTITDISDSDFVVKDVSQKPQPVGLCSNGNTVDSNCTISTDSKFTIRIRVGLCPNGYHPVYDCKKKPTPDIIKTTPSNSIYGTSIPYDKECTATSEPFVALLSPNGGESLTVAQPFTAKWKSCNVPSNYLATFGLQTPDNGGFYSVNVINRMPGYSKGITVNDGEEELSPLGFGSFVAGQYKLRIILRLDHSSEATNDVYFPPANEPIYSDSSDNSLSVVWSNS